MTTATATTTSTALAAASAKKKQQHQSYPGLLQHGFLELTVPGAVCYSCFVTVIGVLLCCYCRVGLASVVIVAVAAAVDVVIADVSPRLVWYLS